LILYISTDILSFSALTLLVGLCSLQKSSPKETYCAEFKTVKPYSLAHYVSVRLLFSFFLVCVSTMLCRLSNVSGVILSTTVTTVMLEV